LFIEPLLNKSLAENYFVEKLCITSMAMRETTLTAILSYAKIRHITFFFIVGKEHWQPAAILTGDHVCFASDTMIWPISGPERIRTSLSIPLAAQNTSATFLDM